MDNIRADRLIAEHIGAVGEGCNGWSGPDVHGLRTDGTAGSYVLTSQILDSNLTTNYSSTSDYKGQNLFSIRAVNAANPTGCSTVTSSTCPGVYADGWIPIRIDPTGSPTYMNLAEIGPEYAGQTMKVSMWDLGEGMKSVEIIDPAGNALDFTCLLYTSPSPRDA